MKPEELERIMEALGLERTGEHGLARFLDVTDRTVYNWLRDGAPKSVAMLLRIMVDKRMLPARIEEKYGGPS